ncbi:hypothetical protein PAHAL_2G323100 [Panicum hallii]|uniref:Uncharacterized protein n=1 Tax=Panicum hallii TaxID=206008 RepID=A0A2S3H130_9POAL|nr:hypothetical protein PAHAL_2G323100 [Panicum hallii]
MNPGPTGAKTMERCVLAERTNSRRRRRRTEECGGGAAGQKRLRTSRMVALQSGQLPRPARSSRAQARQKVWPQGMKAAPLPRATHTQHRPPTPPPPPFSFSSAGASSSASTRFQCPPAARAAHCCSVRSSSAIRDTLSPRAAGAGSGSAATVPPVAGQTPRRADAAAAAAGARSSSASRMTSRSVRRLLAARSPSPSSSRSLRRSRRLDDAASCSASVTPRRGRPGGTRTSIPRLARAPPTQDWSR